ncbi:MAG: glycosyltransferase, partial [Psychroflexus sp.]|nr:glycosyltransferase [Psychroflexus sp.]
MIVNQTKKGQELKSELENILVVNSYDVGLSKSRNLALKNCKTTYGVIADDDVIFQTDCLNLYSKAIQQKLDLAFYSFKSCDLQNRDRKEYPDSLNEFCLPLKKFKPSSIEIMLNIPLIKKRNLKFDENFGLGAHFPVGEEKEFLIKLLRANLKAMFFPETVVKHQQESSRN